MLPLSQPELQHPLQPDQRAIKTEITLASNEWCQTSAHDVSKTGDAGKIEDEEKDLPVDEPVCRLRR